LGEKYFVLAGEDEEIGDIAVINHFLCISVKDSFVSRLIQTFDDEVVLVEIEITDFDNFFEHLLAENILIGLEDIILPTYATGGVIYVLETLSEVAVDFLVFLAELLDHFQQLKQFCLSYISIYSLIFE
jgi:hypothetical protein